jgi:hypothetical protein
LGAITASLFRARQTKHIVTGLNAISADVDTTRSEYHAWDFVFSPKAKRTSWVAFVFASEKRHLSIASVKAKF